MWHWMFCWAPLDADIQSTDNVFTEFYCTDPKLFLAEDGHLAHPYLNAQAVLEACYERKIDQEDDAICKHTE